LTGRRRRVDTQHGIEAALGLVGGRRLLGGLRQPLQPLGLAVGCSTGRVHRSRNAAERVLPGLADFIEGALDVRLAFDAKADRDLRRGHRLLLLALAWCSIAIPAHRRAR
jgi:hypothetical protein